MAMNHKQFIDPNTRSQSNLRIEYPWYIWVGEVFGGMLVVMAFIWLAAVLS
jgi:hypothetical protein